jgi:hypothetical protein
MIQRFDQIAVDLPEPSGPNGEEYSHIEAVAATINLLLNGAVRERIGTNLLAKMLTTRKRRRRTRRTSETRTRGTGGFLLDLLG